MATKKESKSSQESKEESKSSPESLGGLSRAADRIRESAKWLIASFAAVGAILVAGLQLSQLGALTNEPPDYRLFWAGLGLVLALIGVVTAVGAAGSVVTKSFVTLKWLKEQPKDDPAKLYVEGDTGLLGGYATVEELKNAYDEAMRTRRDALKAHYQDPNNDDKRKAADAADKWTLTLDQAQKDVVERASFSMVRQAYKVAQRVILFAVLLTAAGIGAFAWAANPPATESAAVVLPAPTEVLVRIDPEDRPSLQRRLGAECDLSQLQAVALADEGENYDVASVATDECEAALFTLTPGMGRIVSEAGDEEPLSPGTPSGGHKA